MQVIRQGRQLYLILLAFLLIGGRHPASSQNPQLQTKSDSVFPTVGFSCSQWGANPPYYSIAVDSAGNATYQSTPQSATKTGLPYSVEFLASSTTRTKVFQLAEKLHFFRGTFKDINSGRDVGTYTLTFGEGSVHNQITYHSSPNLLVQNLTTLFGRISTTLEFGRRLSALQTANSVGMDAELEKMAQMIHAGQLAELQAVTPVLQQVASDEKLSQVCRQRAQAILNEVKVAAITP
jgi:hypothetical protein